MALNTFECNYLTPLHFKGLTSLSYLAQTTGWGYVAVVVSAYSVLIQVFNTY